jgi:hypothetical protein
MGAERVDRPEERAGEEVCPAPARRWPPTVQEAGFLKPRRASDQEVRLTDHDIDGLLNAIEKERAQRARGANKLIFTVHSLILGDSECMMGSEHHGACWYRRPNEKWDNDFRKRLP